MEEFPHIKNAPESEVEWFEALVALARYLRGPDGCPWDRKQTSADFVRFLREEAEELSEAYVLNSTHGMREEWGDTFFCMLAAAAAAETEGRFTLREALRAAHEKMVRRHSHVFGPVTAETPEDAVHAWNAIKAEEQNGLGQRQDGQDA